MDPDATILEQMLLPHLDAAYNLARWLAGDDHDAEDIVQESCLRALKFFVSFRGGNPRAWLLTIVRNTGYTWLKCNRKGHEPLEDNHDALELEDPAVNPEALSKAAASCEEVREALARLPVEFREVIVLREMEDHSYKEIAEIAGVPIGTVMSRLARGRQQLQRMLTRDTSAREGER